MKKITFLFTAFLLASSLQGQLNLNVAAPLGANASFFGGPCGTASYAYRRSSQLITASELQALTSNSINSVSFVLSNGTGAVACPGSMTVYIENTNDVTYTKSANWTSAITGMNQIYAGNMTVPVSNSPTTITLPFSSPFNYTGSGIYIAFDWVSNGPFDSFANSANYNLTFSPTNDMGADMASGVASPTLVYPNGFRSVLLFGAVNTATNELGLTQLTAPGKVAKQMAGGHVISCSVKNAGILTANNIQVTLSVSGANTFSTTTSIGMLNDGAITSLSFAAFSPTATGINTITVSLPSDVNLSNNTLVWTQSVTCDVVANNPPLSASSFTDQSWGTGTGGIIATRINNPGTSSLSALSLVVGTGVGSGNPLYGVLLNSAGNIIAYSHTITSATQMIGTLIKFQFNTKPVLTANTTYYLGVAHPSTSFPFASWVDDTYSNAGFFQTTPVYQPKDYFFWSSAIGGTFSPTEINYLGLEPELIFANNSISASASRTIICELDDAPAILLNATGANTYTWSTSTTGSNISVVPNFTSVPGIISYTVEGFNTTIGCKSANAVVTVSMEACTGTAEQNDTMLIQVFPNPVNGSEVTIQGLSEAGSAELYNPAGQLLSKQRVDSDKYRYKLSELPAGIYFLKIKKGGETIQTVKLVYTGN